MNSSTVPRYLLYSEAASSFASQGHPQGHWRFCLKTADGSLKLEASDNEFLPAPRLELLAVVRGLEALEQPSVVTLLTDSRYVHRGLRFGMPQWRSNDWQWEKFGEMAPIQDDDLWRRIDRALDFHELHCRVLRRDSPRAKAPAPKVLKRRKKGWRLALGALWGAS